MNGVCVFAVWVLSATIPLSSAPATQTASTPLAFTAKVRLEVNSQYDQVKQVISKVMVEQLRTVEGVQLVEANPQWTIRIETVVVPDANGGIACLGLSEVVLEHRPYVKMLQTLAQAWRYLLVAGILQQDQQLDQGLRQLVSMVEGLPQTTDSTTLKAHRMCVVAVSNVEQACRDIITDFNGKIVRPYKASQAGGNTGMDKPPVAASTPSSNPTK